MPPRKLSPNEIYGVRWIPFTLQTTFLPLSLSLSLSLSQLRYAPTPIVRVTWLGLSSSLDATIVFTARRWNNRRGRESKRKRERERERERERGCTDLPIRGVKRSVSGTNDYPAERSTPRYPTASGRARTIPSFLRQPAREALWLAFTLCLSTPLGEP